MIVFESLDDILKPKQSGDVMKNLPLDSKIKHLLTINGFKFTHKLNYSTDIEYYFDDGKHEIIIKNTDSPEFIENAFKYFKLKTNESLDNILLPKSDFTIIEEIFQNTELENEDPDEIFYFETRTLLGSLGETLLEENNINYKKVNNQYYIIWGRLIDLIKYYTSINWDKKSYIQHIIDNGIREEELPRRIELEIKEV